MSSITSGSSVSSKFGAGVYGNLQITTKDGVVVLEKQAKDIDYTVELEYEIGRLVNTLNSEHFCRYYDLVWTAEPLYYMARPKLLLEKIEGSTLLELEETLSDVEKRSLVARTLAAASVLNETCDISHNDLHMSNVMVRKCNSDVQAYIFPDGDEMAALTHGKSPVIIDFGLACPGKAVKQMLMASNFSDIGYFPHEMDKIGDARRLIFAVIYGNPDCVPTEIVKMLTLPKLTTAGYFEEFTFPSIIETLEEKLHYAERAEDIPTVSKEVPRQTQSLFAAHVRLPLIKFKVDTDLKSAFDDLAAELDDENLKNIASTREIKDLLLKVDADLTKVDVANILRDVNIKNILDGNVEYLAEKVTPQKLRKLTRSCKTVVRAMNNVIFDVAEKASLQKRKLYEKSPVQRTRDVARYLMPGVTYTPKMLVSVYIVKDRETLKCSFTKAECAALNRKVPLADVIRKRMCGS